MRQLSKILVVLAVGGFALASCSDDGAKSAGPTVNVEVSDKAGSGSWTLTASPASIAAGKITFTVKNTGTIEHEMVVLKTDTAADALAINEKGRVSEDASVGEVSEFGAGKTESVTLDLKPGHYVLICNIAAHYGKGMTTSLTVT